MKRVVCFMISAGVIVLLGGCVQTADNPNTTEVPQATQNTGDLENNDGEQEEDISYDISDKANRELTWVFMNSYFFGIGSNKIQNYADLSQHGIENLVCGTIMNNDGPFGLVEYKPDGEGVYRYSISREVLSDAMMDCYGLDLKNFDFSSDEYPIITDEGDVLSWYGGDYSEDSPNAKIESITEDKDTGLVTVTGSVYDFSDDPSEYRKFRAMMKATDSGFFDGHTLLSFMYDEPNANLAELKESLYLNENQ